MSLYICVYIFVFHGSVGSSVALKNVSQVRTLPRPNKFYFILYCISAHPYSGFRSTHRPFPLGNKTGRTKKGLPYSKKTGLMENGKFAFTPYAYELNKLQRV